MPTLGRLTYLEALPPAAARTARAQPPLVLIHAFPLNARFWEPQLQLADRGFRILAPQLRGFDGTPGDPPVNTVDDYAGDIIDLLDGLHIDDAVIGGLSMGGYITLALFRLAPRYFRGMVLADTRSQADSEEGLEGRRRMLAMVRDGGAGAVADEMLPKLVGETTKRSRPEVVDHTRALIMASSPDAIAGGIRAMMSRPDSTPLLSSIHCPTLIVVGEEDAITPTAQSEAMHRAIAGSELTILPHAGHLANLEQPAAFNDALLRFLEHRV